MPTWPASSRWKAYRDHEKTYRLGSTKFNVTSRPPAHPVGRVEALTGWPFQRSCIIPAAAYPTFRGRLGQACSKSADGQSGVEQAVVLTESQLKLLRTRNTDAEAVNRSSAAELSSAIADRDSALSNSAQANKAVALLQTEVADLQQQLSDAVSALRTIKEEQATSSGQAAQVQTQVVGLQATITRLEQEGQQLRKALQEQEDESKKMKAEAEQTAQALEQAGQNNECLATSNAELKQTLAQQKEVTEEEQANALSAQQQLQEAHTLTDQLNKALEAKDSMLAAVQDELQRADEQKVVTADEAKAEAQELEAAISILRADLANQEQVVKAQQSDLLAVPKLKSQLRELTEQLEEQRKMFAAKEDQVAKLNAVKEQQLQEAVSQSSSLSQEVVALKDKHTREMAAAACLHEEAVQVQQRDAKKQLAEQGRAVASAEKAVRDANDASKQASQDLTNGRTRIQAAFDAQQLKVADLEEVKKELESACCLMRQDTADLKQKHKERVTALVNRQEEARRRQQGADTHLAEKGNALAVAQQELKDTKAALEQASQVQAKAAQKEVAAAQQEAELARDKAGALDSKLQRSQEKNAAQQQQLVQLQAEVASLQQQVQSIQATGAAETRPLPAVNSGPMDFTSQATLRQLQPQHPQLQPQQPRHPQLQPQQHPQQHPQQQPQVLQPRQTPLSISQGRPAAAAAVPRLEPHHQPSQLQVVNQPAARNGNGNGSGRPWGTTPHRGIHGAELAQPNKQQQQQRPVQPEPGFAGAHVKALVGAVVRVDNSTQDATHEVFCNICRSHRWNWYIDVRGDGNCGYRAIAVGLVVAISALPAESRCSFLQHLQQLYGGMQSVQGLLQFRSAAGGLAHHGYTALLEALHKEPQQAARLRTRGNSAVPSTGLIGFLNNAARSDSMVLFMRALSAFHMLRHPQDFALFLVQFEEEERHLSLLQLCHAYVVPFCEGAQAANAEKMGADTQNTITAIAEALQLVIVVGTGQHAQQCGEPVAQRSTARWSTCQLCLAAKPGHFGVAWA